LFEGGSLGDLSNYEAEHILIEGELANEEGTPETVESTHKISNRQTGRDIEITLYREGFVRFREGSNSRVDTDYLVEFAYLDPRFCSRFLPARGWLALFGLAGLAVAGALYLLPMTDYADYRIHGAAIAGILCVVGLQRFLKKSGRATAFMTTTGRAPVIRFVANIGCIQDAAKAARALKAAIRRHGGTPGKPDQRQLRAEMKVHYRLADDGAISKETCSQSAARILAKFE